MSHESERVYTINLGKVLLSQSQHRAVRAINIIKEFTKRHMKTNSIKIDEDLAHQVWSRGIRSPPRKIRVKMSKTDEGAILVSRYDDEDVGGDVKDVANKATTTTTTTAIDTAAISESASKELLSPPSNDSDDDSDTQKDVMPTNDDDNDEISQTKPETSTTVVDDKKEKQDDTAKDLAVNKADQLSDVPSSSPDTAKGNDTETKKEVLDASQDSTSAQKKESDDSTKNDAKIDVDSEQSTPPSQNTEKEEKEESK